jgi:hypothetical protein
MPITMMTTLSDSNRFNSDTDRVVCNFQGASTNQWRHSYKCQHDAARRYDTAPSADCVEGCGWNRPLVLRTTHKGHVLSTYERNGYDDSDFVAVVWDEVEGRTRHIEYATTRGWSYPNSASADATPEVVAAYEAWRDKQAAQERARKEALAAATPTKGKAVRVKRSSKNVKKGAEGQVFWFGRGRKFGYGEPPFRVGIKFADGSKAFTTASNVEVIQ